MELIKVTIDKNEIEVKKGTTIYQAAKQIGIDIPVLCYMNLEHLKIENRPGGCRICVVEVEGEKNLIPSCSYPVKSNLTIRTNSKRVINARKTIIELLLDNHPNDCPYCEKSIHCELLKLSRKYDIKR